MGVVLSASGEFATVKLLVNRESDIVGESKVVVAFDSRVEASICYSYELAVRTGFNGRSR